MAYYPDPAEGNYGYPYAEQPLLEQEYTDGDFDLGTDYPDEQEYFYQDANEEIGEEDIIINDQYAEDTFFEYEDEEYPETWIPYGPSDTSPSAAAPSGNTQQVIIGALPGQYFPAANDLTHRWCDMFPTECNRTGGNLPFRPDSVSAANSTSTDGDAKPSLKRLDFSGAGLALLLVLLVLLGLNIGWEQNASENEGGDGGKGQDGRAGKKGRDGEKGKDIDKGGNKDKGGARRDRETGGKSNVAAGPEVGDSNRKNGKREDGKGGSKSGSGKDGGNQKSESGKVDSGKGTPDRGDGKSGNGGKNGTSDGKGGLGDGKAGKGRAKDSGSGSGKDPATQDPGKTPEARAAQREQRDIRQRQAEQQGQLDRQKEKQQQTGEQQDRTGAKNNADKANNERERKKNEREQRRLQEEGERNAVKEERERKRGEKEKERQTSRTEAPVPSGANRTRTREGDETTRRREGETTPRKDSAQRGNSSSVSKDKPTGESFLTPTKMLLALVIIIPLLALLSGGSGRSRQSGIVLPPRSSGRKTSSFGSTWVVDEPPRQVINNVNAQGSDIPINIGTGQSTKITEEAPAFETGFQFTGPADPGRLFAMILALALVGLPLLVDYMRGWPYRQAEKPDYLSSTIHYVILGFFVLFCLWKFNQEYGYMARMRPGAIYVTESIRTNIRPGLVAAAQNAETVVWGVEDAIFGDGREILGLGVAVAGIIFLATQSPPKSLPEAEGYASAPMQAMYVLGGLVLGMIFWNA